MHTVYVLCSKLNLFSVHIYSQAINLHDLTLMDKIISLKNLCVHTSFSCMITTFFLVFLLVPNDELLLKTVHDSVIFLHVVFVVEEWSLNVAQVNLIPKSMEVTTVNNAYHANVQTTAACITMEPHNIRHCWYQTVHQFIVASWYTCVHVCMLQCLIVHTRLHLSILAAISLATEC